MAIGIVTPTKEENKIPLFFMAYKVYILYSKWIAVWSWWRAYLPTSPQRYKTFLLTTKDVNLPAGQAGERCS